MNSPDVERIVAEALIEHDPARYAWPVAEHVVRRLREHGLLADQYEQIGWKLPGKRQRIIRSHPFDGVNMLPVFVRQKTNDE